MTSTKLTDPLDQTPVPPPQKIEIADIDLSFWAMVYELLKLSVAAIPAILILNLAHILAKQIIMAIFQSS